MAAEPGDLAGARLKARHTSRTWMIIRKLTQYSFLVLFVALFIWSRRGGWPTALSNLPMRLDPLLVITHLLASRVFLLSSTVALLTILLTIVFGRAWCGWICPLGTTLDLITPRKKKATWKIKESWRSVKYGLLFVILFSALLGNLSLLILDPLTIFFRSLTTSLWPMVDQLITALERGLYQVSIFSEPIASIDAWLRPIFLPSESDYYRQAFLYASVFCTVIALNWLAPRFWCRYLCPLGGLLGLISKFALFRRQVSEECKGCKLCERACPTGTIDPTKGYASDPGECTLCLDCLEACPRSSVVFKAKLELAEWKPYDPGRRQALTSLGVALAGLALARSEGIVKREPAHLLRPPGARENNLMEKCVRCAECMRGCPTNALQPAVAEAGLEGLWTPLLIPRLGYCDYSCNACGQICPVQAIPPLSLEEKRVQVIGKAYIDQNRCIAWSDNLPCIVCEEMCPLPEKAIQLREEKVIDPYGVETVMQLPVVIRERCIGCGICEYKCPVNGASAIQVYVPATETAF